MPPSTTMAVHTNCLYNVHECTGPEPRRTGMHHTGRPACVERSIPSDPDRRRVVPQTGDDTRNGSARCQRQSSRDTCGPRRSPSFSMCHQRRSAGGRRRAGCPTSAPWAATDATPTGRSGPCWKPCPSHPRPASRAPRLTAPGTSVVARWPFGIVLRSIGGRVGPRSTADFLRARENPGGRMTCAVGRRELLSCGLADRPCPLLSVILRWNVPRLWPHGHELGRHFPGRAPVQLRRRTARSEPISMSRG
jgi:hypothetical protein